MNKDAFQEWLKTKRGKELMECARYWNGHPKYFQNILWWAFQAGAESWDVRPSQSGELLHELVERGRKPPTKWMLKMAKEVIEQNPPHP